MAPDLLYRAIMMRIVRRLFPCVALTLFAASVAACGSSNPAAPTSTSASSATPAQTTPATYTLSGLLTDGFSGGILPGIDVLITSGPNQGQDVKTDSTGHYSFSGISSGTFTVQFSAVSYVTQTMTATVAGDTTVNVVLQRM